MSLYGNFNYVNTKIFLQWKHISHLHNFLEIYNKKFYLLCKITTFTLETYHPVFKDFLFRDY
jgi:hypothetical protein